jgi:iron-sulfur cluster insertion protein
MSELANETVRITAGAAKRIAKIVGEDGTPNLRLRVAVSGGGCSGFQYSFSLDDRLGPDDFVVEKDGIGVLIDRVSLNFLRGSEIDFVEELAGAYFRVNNPNARSSCGCGNSFSL